jgi:hypothetical protein
MALAHVQELLVQSLDFVSDIRLLKIGVNLERPV